MAELRYLRVTPLRSDGPRLGFADADSGVRLCSKELPIDGCPGDIEELRQLSLSVGPGLVGGEKVLPL